MNHKTSLAERGFYLPELEKHIEEIHEKCLEEAIKNANILAIRCKPCADEIDISPYIYWINERYNQLEAFSTAAVQATNEKEFGKYDVTLAEQSKTAIEDNIKDTKIELFRKESAAAQIKMEYPWAQKNKQELVIVGITGIETLFSGKAFQLFGDSIIFSFLIALTLGAALWAAAHTIPRIIRLGRTLVQRFLIASGISIFMSVVFFVMGVLRSKYLETAGGITISPVLFMIINDFLFSAAVSYAFFFLPTKKDVADKEQFDQLHEEIVVLESEKEILEASQSNLPVNLGLRLKARLGRMSYEGEMKEWIQRLCRETIGVFVRENIENRKDGVTPSGFRNLGGYQSNISANN